MEAKDKQDHLDQWFLKNEGCTYQEFIDFYNNGRRLIKPLRFFPIPNEIREYLDLPPTLRQFVEKYDLTKDVQQVLTHRISSDYGIERYYLDIRDEDAFHPVHGFSGSHWDLIREEWTKLRS